MGTASAKRTHTYLLAFAIVVVMLALAAFNASGTRAFADEACGYSGCHNGAPIPGTEASAAVEATPCVPGKPKVPAKVRVRKAAKVTGALSPAASEATTVTLYFERSVSGHWRAISHRRMPVAAGAASYAARVTFAKRGTWRARAVHVEASGTKSTSPWHKFRVR